MYTLTMFGTRTESIKNFLPIGKQTLYVLKNKIAENTELYSRQSHSQIKSHCYHYSTCIFTTIEPIASFPGAVLSG